MVPAPSALALIQHRTCFTLNPHIMSLTGKRPSPSHKFNLPFLSTSLKVLRRVFNSSRGWVSQMGVLRAVHLLHVLWDEGVTGCGPGRCCSSALLCRAPRQEQCTHCVPLKGAGGQNPAWLGICKADPSRTAFDLLGTGRCGTA